MLHKHVDATIIEGRQVIFQNVRFIFVIILFLFLFILCIIVIKISIFICGMIFLCADYTA